MEEKCPRLGKFYNGCKFEARYDSTPREITVEVMEKVKEIMGNLDEESTVGWPGFLSEKKRVYIHDICVVCGKIIKQM